MSRLVALKLAALLLGSFFLEGVAVASLLHGTRFLPALWCLGWVVLCAVAPWWLWRHWQAGGVRVRCACAVLMAWLVASAVAAATLSRPVLLQLQGSSSQGALQTSVQDAGRTLQLRGGLAPGDAERLKEALSPTVLRLDLALGGGSLAEAQEVAQLVRQQGLATRAAGECDGACVLVFLAGAERYLLPAGRLGLQGLSAPVLNPLWQHGFRYWLGKRYAEAGLPTKLVQRLVQAPAPRHWVAERFDLRSEGVLSGTPFALDIALPPLPGAVPSEYQDALLAHDTWQALSRRYPQELASLPALLAEVHVAEGPEVLQSGLRDLAMRLLLQQLSTASIELRLVYLNLLAEQLAALQSDAQCQALLTPLADVRLMQGLALGLREAQWMQDASLEALAAPKPLRPIELEVLRRSLGSNAWQLLPRLWAPGGQTSPLGCDAARDLIGQVQALSAAPRKLALRRLFDR
jgi:hypothetical protein